MPNTFDEASAATQEMFADDQLTLDDVPPADETPPETEETAETPAETPSEEAPTVQPEALEQATQTAEIAADVAAQKDSELQQVMAEIEALRAQNQQLQGTLDEVSKQNTQNIIEDVLTPPTLDINGLAFADEETQKAEMARYAEAMAAYNRQQVMQEMSPALEYAKKGMREAEKTEVITALSQVPELANIQQMMPQLDRIITNNKWLQSDDMPTDEKYINAYAMAMGIDRISNPTVARPETPKEPTPDELLALYNNNSTFQELVEKQRLENIKQSQQVPPFSASSGAVNAALNIKDKPQTLEEASARTREMFGGM